MESLERLRRLQSIRPQRTHAEPNAPPAHAAGAQVGRAHRIEDLVPGAMIENEAGACFVGVRRCAPAERHGPHALNELLSRRPHTILPFHPPCGLDAGHDFRSAAFIDTETTGLGAGAGIYAFMVGVGTFEPAPDSGEPAQNAFVVRQFFMRSPAEEPALLTAVADLLRDRAFTVTFNGRAFDLPLLRARYAANRRVLPPASRRVPLLDEETPHLDLLLPARRLWRRRLQSCRLINLEAQILGLLRSEEDVPGFLIPQMYVDYVRGGSPQPMQRVFYHNAEDIVSTAALAAAVCQQADATGAQHSNLYGLDWFSLGKSYEQRGDAANAELAYRRAIDSLTDANLREALRCLAALLKRGGRWQDACTIWERWITSVPGMDLTPYIELAKVCEWDARDLEQAEMWAAFGLHTAHAAPAWQRLPGQVAALEQRLERIRRKRSRIESG